MISSITKTITSILFPVKANGKIGSIQLDCSVQETHSFKSDVTDYTVEDGGSISDNIYLQPFRLTIEGIVTDTPLTMLFTGKIGDTIQSLSEEAYDALIDLREKRILFDVVTGLMIYPNMVFESLDINRDKDTGRALHFNAQLKYIEKVSSKIIYIHEDTTNNKSFPDTQNQGNQQAQKTDPGQRARSLGCVGKELIGKPCTA